MEGIATIVVVVNYAAFEGGCVFIAAEGGRQRERVSVVAECVVMVCGC